MSIAQEPRKKIRGAGLADVGDLMAFVDQLPPDKFFTPAELVEHINQYRLSTPLVNVALIFCGGTPGPIRALNVLYALAVAVDANIWLYTGCDRYSFGEMRTCLKHRLQELHVEGET